MSKIVLIRGMITTDLGENADIRKVIQKSFANMSRANCSSIDSLDFPLSLLDQSIKSACKARDSVGSRRFWETVMGVGVSSDDELWRVLGTLVIGVGSDRKEEGRDGSRRSKRRDAKCEQKKCSSVATLNGLLWKGHSQGACNEQVAYARMRSELSLFYMLFLCSCARLCCV